MKKILSFFGVVIVSLLLIDHFQLYVCDTYRCRASSDALLLGVLILSSLSFLSALVLSLSPTLFTKWWKFARVAIPLILVISIGINLQLHHTSRGFFNMDDMFDIPVHVLMYSIFIIGSVVQVWRGYRQK